MPKIVKSFSLNAHLMQAWFNIIYAAEARPWIRVAPVMSAEPITGFPPGYIERIINSKTENMFDLNLGPNSCRSLRIDLEEGALYLDVSIDNTPCPYVRIPVEAIMSVFTPDIESLCSDATCLPFATNLVKIRYEEGEVRGYAAAESAPNCVIYHQLPENELQEILDEMRDHPIQRDNVSGPPVNQEPKLSPPRRGHLSIIK